MEAVANDKPAPTLAELQRLLPKVVKYGPKIEKTLFSIAGRGHFENPTSDLLAFFMDQNEAHGFGTLFLDAFFARRPEWGRPNLECVHVSRNVMTRDGKFIDIIVAGRDWVLIVENKIWHSPVNPFNSYEEYAKEAYPNKKRYFALLSPSGDAVNDHPNWVPFTYRDYCDELKNGFIKTAFQNELSKWQVFAREFIIHLEMNLYGQAIPMTPEQVNLVESHFHEMDALRKLKENYDQFLKEELTRRLHEATPGYQFEIKMEKWAFIFDNGPERIILQTPTQPSGFADGKFCVAFLARDLKDSRYSKVFSLLPKVVNDRGRWLESHIDTREEAMDVFSNLLKLLYS